MLFAGINETFIKKSVFETHSISLQITRNYLSAYLCPIYLIATWISGNTSFKFLSSFFLYQCHIKLSSQSQKEARDEEVKQLIKYFANVERWSICCPEDDSPILPGIISTCLPEIDMMNNSGLISSIQLILNKPTQTTWSPAHCPNKEFTVRHRHLCGLQFQLFPLPTDTGCEIPNSI